jgi:hypothetical protein
MQEFANEITKQFLPFLYIMFFILIAVFVITKLIKFSRNSGKDKEYREYKKYMSENHSASKIVSHVVAEKTEIEPEKNYVVKPLMTNSEFQFYKKLKILESRTDGKIIIAPQINLATILKKVRNGDRDFYQNELYRNIDFAIFSRDYQKLLLLIELNDASHFDKKRRARDAKVREICEIANVKLLTFYTDKSNETGYVISRILDKIKEQK